MLDSYAVLELGVVIQDGPAKGRAFAALDAEVKAGSLVFPDDVLAECRELGEGETPVIWAGAISGSRIGHTFPGATPMAVLAQCPDLMDPEDQSRCAHVSTACLAWHIINTGGEAQVVSEDGGFGGDRVTLAEACGVLGLPCCGVVEMLTHLGLGDHLI